MEESRMASQINLNNELRKIRRKIDNEKCSAKKIRLLNAYEDLVCTLKSPVKRWANVKGSVIFPSSIGKVLHNVWEQVFMSRHEPCVGITRLDEFWEDS